jgi:hypothetical protein
MENLRLVTHLIGDLAALARARGVEWDDLWAAGAMGLVKAADSFNPKKGVRFSIWARRWIFGECRRQLAVFRPLQTGRDFSDVIDHRLSPIPELVPLFPIPALTPASHCGHFGPIRDSVFICGVCLRAAPWIESHPDMQLSWRDLHKRRHRRRATIPLPTIPKETRKEKRRRLFGERRAAVDGEARAGA